MMARRRPLRSILGLLAAMALLFMAGLSGCLITYDLDSVEEPAAASTAPVMRMIAPEEEQAVGDTLSVHLVIENFNLVQKWGQANVSGEGHLQVSIDDMHIPPDVPCVGDNDPAGCGRQGITLTEFNIDVSGLATDSPTTHRLRVVPVNNDRTPHPTLAPIVRDFVKLPAGQ